MAKIKETNIIPESINNQFASTDARWARLVKRAPLYAGVLVVVAALGIAGYFYYQLSEIKKNPPQVAADETKTIVEAVGKLMVLPTDEQPTLATVSDPEKLKDQKFFATAAKGDKVLIYSKAKKAILYNPTENKIVEVAPVNIGDTDSQVSGSSTETTTKKK